MKRIIVPVDFSIYSENAILSASKIAAKGDASITCVNVVNSPVDWERLSENDKLKHQEILDLEAEAKDKLKAFILDHQSEYNPIEGVVTVGTPSQGIINVATKHAADLIVIGAYGRGHEEGKFIGSTMQKVLRLAKCPVLAVKKPIMNRDLKKIVYASLFNEISRPAFTRIKPIIKALGASVHFLYINTPSSFTDSSKAEILMNNYSIGHEDLVIHRHIYNHDEAEKGIMQFSESQKAGLIGIATNTRKVNTSYQIGVTETIIYRSEIPVLSVKFS